MTVRCNVISFSAMLVSMLYSLPYTVPSMQICLVYIQMYKRMSCIHSDVRTNVIQTYKRMCCIHSDVRTNVLYTFRRTNECLVYIQTYKRMSCSCEENSILP